MATTSTILTIQNLLQSGQLILVNFGGVNGDGRGRLGAGNIYRSEKKKKIVSIFLGVIIFSIV